MTKYIEVFIVTADLDKTEFSGANNSNTLKELRLVEFVICDAAEYKALLWFSLFFQLLNSNFGK